MAIQTASAVPNIEWDDGGVLVFSFLFNGVKLFSGFVHIQLQLAVASGSAVQVNAILQQINQQQIQFASDPQTWIDTVKNAARSKNAINITFEDAISVQYTTQTNLPFALQQLFSLAG